MSLTQRAYTSLLRVLSAGRGLAWHVDDATTLRIDPRCRWIRNSSYEADVAAYLRAGIRPGQCCIDVGAHVGFYAMQMALWTAPGGQVIAFEPNPTARAVLRANVALNHFSDRVTIEPSAAGAAPATADLFHSGDTSGLSRLDAPNPDSSSGPPVRVPVITLDEYCATRRIRPDWILIDAEGADLEVLRGAAALLRDHPGAGCRRKCTGRCGTRATPRRRVSRRSCAAAAAAPSRSPARRTRSRTMAPYPSSLIADPASPIVNPESRIVHPESRDARFGMPDSGFRIRDSGFAIRDSRFAISDQRSAIRLNRRSWKS